MGVENFLIFGCLFIILSDYALKSPLGIKRGSEIQIMHWSGMYHKTYSRKAFENFPQLSLRQQTQVQKLCFVHWIVSYFLLCDNKQYRSGKWTEMSNANWVMIRNHNSRSESCSLFSVHSNCKLDCEAEISMAMMEMISTSIRAHIKYAYRWTNSVEKFSIESIDSKMTRSCEKHHAGCIAESRSQSGVYIVENHQNALIEHIIENWAISCSTWQVLLFGWNIFQFARTDCY